MPPLTKQLLEPTMAPPTRVNTLYSMASVDPRDYEEHNLDTESGNGELEEWNSRLNVKWNEAMSHGNYTTSANYQTVQALLLYHDESGDDLGVGSEVRELETVFKDLYNFGVQSSPIHSDYNRRSQAQVNAIVAKWAYDHDGPNTLLIVYFAGHGNTSENGELYLSGRKASPYDVGGDFNQIVWDKTEQNLHGLSADVLQIFDCCFAGTFARPCVGGQTIEFLAASDDSAPIPGESSFTTALIAALRDLRDQGGRFSISHLETKIRKIFEAQNNALRPTWHRLQVKPTRQRILLHPLKKATAPSKERKASGQGDREPENEYVVKLKFAFHSRPTDENIIHLGEDLNKIVSMRDLPMSHIQFDQILPQKSMLLEAVQRLKNPLEDLRARKRQRGPPTENWSPITKKAAFKLRDDIETLDDQVHKVREDSDLLSAQFSEEPQRQLDESQPRIREPST